MTDNAHRQSCCGHTGPGEQSPEPKRHIAEDLADVEQAVANSPEPEVSSREEAVEESAAPAATPKPATDITSQRAVAEAAGSDVPPRDAAERLTFGTYAVVTKASAGGKPFGDHHSEECARRGES